MSTGRMFCRAAMPERTMRRCLFSFFQKVRRTSVNGVIPYLREMNFVSVMFRLILAMVCGGMIGLERGRKRRPAGFRTYMLVCLGAALTMLLSQYEFAMVMGPWNGIAQELGMKTDVSRFGAQVINGIGFLGAGTILVTGRQEVKGLTTAAGLWASACMGLAIGAGFYECVVLCTVLIFLCMRFLPAFENYLVEKARFINIYVEFRSLDDLGSIISRIKSQGRAHLRRGHQPRPHRALDQSERGICHPAAAEAAAYAGPHGDRRAGQRIHDRRSLKGGDEMLSIFNGVRDITMLSVTVRLCLAVLCGGMIGLERAFKRRPAGFRTHILICLGASLTTMTSQYLYLNMHYFTDMARLGAQVVAGIGFIGAGTIIVTRRQRVKGLTTAAGLWTSAIVGLAIGGGFYEGGIAVSVLVLLAELVFSRLEYRILDNVPEINLYMEYSDKDCLENVLQLLRQNRLSISNMEITRSAGSEEHNACAIFALHLKKGCRTEELIQKIQRIEGVVSVEEI